MIKTFKHKGLKIFFETGSKKKIEPSHAKRISLILVTLNRSKSIDDMDLPSFELHELKGNRKGNYSVTVKENWRITFYFEGEDAILVNYEDYH